MKKKCSIKLFWQICSDNVFDHLNGISNRNLNKLKHQKMCKVTYANWCQKIYGDSTGT